MAKVKKAFFCRNCGYESAKWVGKCPSCGEWNTFVEETVQKEPTQPSFTPAGERNRPQPVREIQRQEYTRTDLGNGEMNRVLGGGLVQGSMILLGGDVHVGSNYIETLDEYTIESLRRLYFDKVFLTVNGVDLEYGYSINSRLQPPLYRHLLDNSRDFYLLADRHKFGKRAFAYFCAIDRIANVVTNPETDGRYLAFYRSSGVNVYTG